MEINEAIDTMKRLRIALATANVDGKRVLEPISMAIEALEKQIPKKPIIIEWNPAKCPCCGEELSESLGDGYYKHWTTKKICDCGQKLRWD